MAKKQLNLAVIDQMAKAMLVSARTMDYVLESRAVEVATDVPLSSSKVQVIRLLAQRAGQTSSQVARYLGVSKPAVSQIIDSMVRSKLVTRKTSKTDRREVNLTLTARGMNLNKVVRAQQRTFIRNALRGVNGTTSKRWIDTLNEVASALGRADSAFEEYCMQCGAHEDGTCVLVGGDANCHFLAYESRTALASRGAKANGKGKDKGKGRKTKK